MFRYELVEMFLEFETGIYKMHFDRPWDLCYTERKDSWWSASSLKFTEDKDLCETDDSRALFVLGTIQS